MPSTIALLDAELVLPRRRVTARAGLVSTCDDDEDVVTLAVEACLPLLARSQDVTPDAIVLATLSSPMAEGGVAQVISEALDLQGPRPAIEVSGTLSAGVQALLVASGLLSSGCERILVVAADRRRDLAGRAVGDGALALLVGRGVTDSPVATLTLGVASTELIRDRWRLQGDISVVEAERSLTIAQRPPEASGLVRYRVDDPPIPRVGMMGTGHFLLRAVLDTARSSGPFEVEVSASGVSQRLTLTSGPEAGRVADGLLLRIADGVEASRTVLTNHPEAFNPYASQSRSWRDRSMDLRLEGQLDTATGEVLFPPIPESSSAGLIPHRLGRKGRVLAMTLDHVYSAGSPLTMLVVEVEGGGRVYCQAVDGDKFEIGDPVELVLRRLHDGGGLPHYFMKARGLRTTRDPLEP